MFVFILLFSLSSFAQSEFIESSTVLSARVGSPEGITKNTLETEIIVTNHLEGFIHAINIQTGSQRIIFSCQESFDDFYPGQHRLAGIFNMGDDNYLFVSQTYLGGSIIMISKNGQSGDYKGKVILKQAGMLNDIFYNKSTRDIYTSAFLEKYIIKVHLDDLLKYKNGKTFDEKSDKWLETKGYPNGIHQLSQNSIYYVESGATKSRFMYYAPQSGLHQEIMSKRGAWFDGLIWHAKKRMFVISDNKNSELDLVRWGKHLTSIKITFKGSRNPFGLAEMVFIGNDLYVTDLWKAGNIDMLLYAALDGTSSITGWYGRDIIDYNNRLLRIEFFHD